MRLQSCDNVKERRPFFFYRENKGSQQWRPVKLGLIPIILPIVHRVLEEAFHFLHIWWKVP